MGLSVGLTAIPSSFTFYLIGPAQVSLDTSIHPAEILVPEQSLTVMTLNLAHGRKTAFHQILQSPATIQANLTEIANLLKTYQPHLVGLQEADGPSLWSGRFNHVHHLATQANYAHSIQAFHVQGLGLYYGTALLARWPITSATSLRFDYVPPTPAKGFVIATLPWAHSPSQFIDVISLHLDFARRNLRQQQLQQLIAYLAPREHPVIVMGDFNCNWLSGETTLSDLVKALDLQVYQPEAPDLNTFPAHNPKQRIDWILVSHEFQFTNYQVLNEVVSDHSAVIATLKGY